MKDTCAQMGHTYGETSTLDCACLYKEKIVHTNSGVICLVNKRLVIIFFAVKLEFISAFY